ncbi:hypothetical protein M406DRAFT_63052 [Cryphonectria parasitica EP155]|uniref:Homeobox domain-containing protein n=1 Tax=Cryphonectria parasitica (strain ATCC 38755 / EP155) TaxID=660469 RepID=A0A9P4YA22_CRYP1|nr:uncharacterized protein M406DRAFT_63052 [Cryphonectria parasitica EP155]KAF3769092.1 hypothetical protein M406DRAFT_63052 [Cryphonectria parasitica EP155]
MATHRDSFQSNASERHPKGKRKRTAAKDKAILEAAYNANPKPDKTARLDIVKRVSLNEKEVQIWFQNRRQNDRRKSRPLSPQEIAALQYGSMQVLPDTISAPPYMSTLPPSSSLPAAHNTSPVPPSSAPERGNASPHSDTGPSRPDSAGHPAGLRRESAPSGGIPAVGPSSQPVGCTADQPPQLYRSQSVGYFANRLHASTSFQAARQSPDSYRYVNQHDLRPTHSSKFRLSMSMEGKAELVSQPSPPRLSPTSFPESSVPLDRPHLHRSQSAAGAITLPPISALTASLEDNDAPRLHPRLYRSRSRDVHLWELACEANSGEHRDELTAYAERESSGSAIAAISLLRTLSSSSHSPASSHNGTPLQLNSAKRNARPSAQHHHHHHAKKPKLGRASSSIARLQNNLVNMVSEKPTTARSDEVDVDEDDLRKVKMSILLSPGGNESDKENWSPDDDGNPVFRGSHPGGRRPLPSAPTSRGMQSQHARRRVLEDDSNRTMLGRASTAPGPRRKKGESPIAIFDDSLAERSGVTDDEVEKFMRGEVSPSKKGAASAIAGLLALSQGHWR